MMKGDIFSNVVFVFAGALALKPPICGGFSSHDIRPATRASEAATLHASRIDENSIFHSKLLDRRCVIAGSVLAPVLFQYVSISSANAYFDPLTTSKAATIPDWILSGRVNFPVLALNTAGLSLEETTDAVRLAKQVGITHIDFHPGTERDGVARYLSESEDNRNMLFLNTKIRKAPPGTSPKDAAALAKKQIQDDLKVLGVDSVDMLMLRDNPDPSVIQAQWAVLEEALSEGRTRSVGVINFCEAALRTVLQTAKVTPAVNYIMVHIGMGKDAKGLRSFGESKGIRTFSYGQTGEPEPFTEILDSPVLKRIGRNHGGKSPEQVALKWVLQNGIAASVRPSSDFGRCYGKVCEQGISTQADCFGWDLTASEMAELDALTSPDGNPTLFSSTGCPGAFGT